MACMATLTAKTTLRVSPEDLAEIDRRARAHGMSRTGFLVALGAGRGLPLTDCEGLSGRVEVLEHQMRAACKSLDLLGLPVDGGVV